MIRRTLLAVVALSSALTLMPEAAAASGTWVWPVTGPVIRGFDPPDDPYGAGHRGIDIAAPVGTPVLAAEAGTVTFAGKVGGQLFVTINHGAGLVSSYSWVSALRVRKNDVVARGQTIALSGTGHPSSGEPPHLHFGVRLNGQYVDPLAYLSPMSVSGLIRLAPLPSAA
jgi:murein DD-endopeptidase MepM/ murein hydrolase activator NlpD